MYMHCLFVTMASLWRTLQNVTWRLCPVVLLLYAASLVSAHGSHSHAQWEFLGRFSGPVESTSELWLYSLASTAVISAAPFLILFLIPLENASEHNTLLKVLLSFASGGLLGDAFLHLIPHAVAPHDHTHSHDDHEHHVTNDTHHDDHEHHREHHHDDHDEHAHDHMADMMVGLWVLCGIVTFLVVEKFVRLAKGGHSHGGLPHKEEEEKEKESQQQGQKNGSQMASSGVRKRKGGKEKQGNSSAPPTPSPPSHSGGRDIKVAGYLNLAADFSHNFTDGLAIGASYLAGRSVGVITTITILIHEVPHEIGDFAILVQSGYPKRKAMMLQLVTAVGAICGTICGLLAEGIGESATAWILPFTAGGFIYIATVSVIPELLEDTSLKKSFLEITAMFVGIGMMILIAYIE